MVLGIRNKNRRGPSIQVDYIIHVQDIKPWPPTQSFKTVRSVLIQWENGERSSGSTSTVTPSLDNGKIEFNESFRLPITLSRDLSIKSGDADVYHKNLLEFNLYEPRRDKTVKGQLLGSAIVDLADIGIVKEVISVTAPMNCTRSFRNTTQPILHLRIQTYDKARSGSSLRGRLAKEGSLDKNDIESVSELMNEEYADEAEVASLTDDDISSHSSMTASLAPESNGASPLQNENDSGSGKDKDMKDYSHILNCGRLGRPGNLAVLTHTSELVSLSSSEDVFAASVESYKSRIVPGADHQIIGEVNLKYLSEEGTSISTDNVIQIDAREKPNADKESAVHQASGKIEKKIVISQSKSSSRLAATADIDDLGLKDGDKHGQNGWAGQILDKERLLNGNSLDAIQDQLFPTNESPQIRDRHRHVKSVRSSMDSSRVSGSIGGLGGSTGKKEAQNHVTEKGTAPSDSKTQELERRIEVLETELREAAAVEIAVYSIVAEHGSSINKVHAPARRLSRLYLHAGSGMKRASAARSTVSGLVVVAKACGNDVPRLTFWLSNCVVFRAIISEAFAEEQLPVSAGPLGERNGISSSNNKTSPILKWKVSPSEKQIHKNAVNGRYQDWENPYVLIAALEKLESWIFSRIVESVWWQTLTPHMQSSAAKMIGEVVDSGVRKNNKRSPSSCSEQQVNFSLELWRRAFKGACERLCPVRSGGHECGCLPALAKLIMEHCVARLDVAMFNAILRESGDDIPTDPVSDPITDSKVLPIPAGKSSFGAGAQLKNAIGNWSRWLADLFGIDDDDEEEEIGRDDDDIGRYKYESSSKCFHLLKSLSDLMMLPKDMLLIESVRREICPSFGNPLIKRIVENFVPDEFCPDPIPDVVFEALNSEDIDAEREGSIANFPCTSPAVLYSPPSASSLVSIVGGNVGKVSQSQLLRSTSVLRRSNMSDDELDELDSPLNSISGDRLTDGLQVSPTEIRPNWKLVQNHKESGVRYQLLREVWDKGLEL